MRRILRIPCPQCQGGDSEYFYTQKAATCTYCGGTKEVNILDHFKTINVNDERADNVRAFIGDVRFFEYLESRK